MPGEAEEEGEKGGGDLQRNRWQGGRTGMESRGLMKSLTTPGHPAGPADPTCPKPSPPTLSPALPGFSLSPQGDPTLPKPSQSSAVPRISCLSLPPHSEAGGSTS